MTYSVSELLYELEQDPTRRILFVEGPRDLAFWRQLVPDAERGDTTVYPISVVNIAEGCGGERGRLFRCAGIAQIAQLGARIWFFADADYDRILGVTTPPNVTLTDGRDLESYAISATECLRKLCIISFTGTETDVAEVRHLIGQVGRTLAAMRIASARYQWKLPFQRTLSNGIRKFLDGKGGNGQLNVRKLLTTLLQNCSMSIAKLSQVELVITSEIAKCLSYQDEEIVHGKDLICLIAWYHSVDFDQIERLLFSCLNYSDLKAFPNLALVERWMREG